MKNDNKKFLKNLINKEVLKIFIIATIIIIVLFISYYGIVKVFSNNRGTFGDMFGGLNAIFSGLAFSGIIITIFIQMKELKAQRKELKQTRKELRSQKEEFQIQNKTLSIQRFENTFFQLMGIHNDIVDSVNHDFWGNGINNNISMKKDSIYCIITNKKGREVFYGYYSSLLMPSLIQKFYKNGVNIDGVVIDNESKFCSKEEILEEYQDIFGDKIEQSLENVIQSKYYHIYKLIQINLGHYYRNFYRILKFIDNKVFVSLYEIENDEWLKNYSNAEDRYQEPFDLFDLLNNTKRYEYTSMLRAQLSDYELWWLTFNCLYNEGEKLKVLVEKYTLLKNHPDKEFLENLTKLGLYKESAYKKDSNSNIYDMDKYNEAQKILDQNEPGFVVQNYFIDYEEQKSFLEKSEIFQRLIG